MKPATIFFSISLCTFIFPGCSPSSRLYDTPPLYFGSPHQIPNTDTAGRFSLSATLLAPLNSELRAEYTPFKNVNLGFSYFGLLGATTEEQDNRIGEYQYKTGTAEGSISFNNNFGQSEHSWFIIAAFAGGSSRSLVVDYDGTPYYYSGKFSRLSFTPGLKFKLGRMDNMIFSSRQSFVNFSEYKLPDTSFTDRKQFLSDLQLTYKINFGHLGFQAFIGTFVNGYQSGSRTGDGYFDSWRIFRPYGGLTFSVMFPGTKK